MGIDLPLIWAVIILFGVMMYVVMDGFDLGIGLLYPFVPAKADRDVMMNTVAPVWDGNETWLVLGGAGLFVAFPIAYAAILSAFYLPLIFMLVGLIFRGVAFEFRFKAPPARQPFWDRSFTGGSYTATFFQGVTLGAFLEGVPMRDGQAVAGSFSWLAPFPLFVGLGLIAAYALLGATWLVMKTESDLQQRMRELGLTLTWVLLLVIGVISIWTPLSQPAVAHKWFSWPNLLYFSPVPLLVLVSAALLRRSLARRGHDAVPFLLTLGLVFLGYSGLGISLWPHVIPPSVTIWQAAGPPQSLGFTLVGALLIVPMILGYTAWSYWVFRGKVRGDEGYH
ncbi:cyanide-insensitive cytochrome bd quinol oxidase subunit II [Ramlibacter solisilvae]|uniref:Ubiquinol oxidase subunit II n=1 Tax=Ramlibacter tataouinensis TaxID=94132 RepID=A0A127JVJ8_9BURK|nr:cytochrome d ubiquinol oxidase subunit II [Ramlibacter tataouinensis]AMO23944.1 ubiquinol oxidase subunit II [Ramlibacter tataouinensis]